MCIYDTISHNKKEPLAMRSSKLFGIETLAGLPKVKQVYYLSLIPSNSLSALGVSLEPALQEEIEQNINKHTLDARGKDYIHRSVDTRMASLASNIRNANSKMVNDLLVTNRFGNNGILSIGVPKASK